MGLPLLTCLFLESDYMENEEGKKISEDEQRNSRRRFLKIAGLAAGATAVAATVTTLTPGPLRKTTPDSTVFAAAAPVPPNGLTPFVDPLVIPPVLTPNTTKYPGKDYYEISIVPGTGHKFHSSLPATTLTQSYFATAPVPGVFHYLGPTIVAQSKRPVKLKVTNKLALGLHQIHQVGGVAGTPMDYTIMGTTDPTKIPPNTAVARWTDEHRVCVHLHGGKTLTQHDGGPRDWFSPAGSTQANPYPEGAAIDPAKSGSHTYEYPNDQDAAMLWYHDHAWGITRFNPFLGQAAAYIIRDKAENKLIEDGKIPNGAYEVPIVLQERLLDDTGYTIYPPTDIPGTHPRWMPEYFGDTPIVNGRAFPFFNVEPRRYRFRFLNGSQARFYNIWFHPQPLPSPSLPMWVIGSEQGFLPEPMNLNSIVIAPGERFDTIVDFTEMTPGSTLKLMNNAKAPYPDGTGGEVQEIMEFRLVPLVGTDTTSLPVRLKLPPIDPPLRKPLKSKWREIVISEIMDFTGEPLEALLDGQNFTESAPPNPPLFTEEDGETNVWQFINTTGDAHPMHLHLVKFKIVDRQMFDSTAFLDAWDEWIAAGRPKATRPSVNAFLLGAPTHPRPEETGWKDTAKANPGEVLRIIAKFDLPAGAPEGTNIYVCHCHILEHEENDMMFYYGVQKKHFRNRDK